MENSVLYIIGGILLFILIGRFVMKSLLRNVFRKFGLDKPALSQMSEKATHLYKTEHPQGTITNSTNETAQIEYSDLIKIPKKDTTGWEKFRVYIHGWRAPIEVVKDGKVEGYLLDIEFKPAGVHTGNAIHPLGGMNLVRNCYIPKSHLQSIGKLSPMMVLYNPQNPLEIIPDPENENWHYEIK